MYLEVVRRTTSIPLVTCQVFDGHGGTGAASFVQAHILRHLAAGLSEAADMRAAFQAVYDRMDREFEIACATNKELHSGTTAIAVLISGRYTLQSTLGTGLDDLVFSSPPVWLPEGLLVPL